MVNNYIASGIRGIRYRQHDTRKHGKQFDKYFIIQYSVNKKMNTEAIGWASEGWTLQKANEILCEIKRNIREGKHPQSLAEKREMAEEAQKKTEDEKQLSLAETITLNETFEKYFEVHKIETTMKTYENTKRIYRNWIAPSLSNKKLIDISVSDIQTIITNASKNLTPRSVLYIKAVLRQIFNFAKKHDLYFKDNPSMKVNVKMKDNKRFRFLTEKEAELLLNELKKHSLEMHDIALISLYAGLRANEIFSLKWNHILWETNQLAIVDPKNGSTRMAPMHNLVREVITQRFDDTVNPDDYIFKSTENKKIQEISKTFPRVVSFLGFNKNITDDRQKVVFHTLRHTYASWLVMNGVDLYTVQKLMGHKSIQMTQRYSHLSPEYLEKAVNSLNSICFKGV